MARITDYTVVWTVYGTEREDESAHDRLANMVRLRIKEGWQPHGSMSMATREGRLLLAQPMVRDD